MKFLIFAVNSIILLSFPESEEKLQAQKFIVGVTNLDHMRSQLPKDEWFLNFKYKHCIDVLNSIWIFPESYSDTLRKLPFAAVHRQHKASSIGTLILFYDNKPEIIPAFCCQHDENIAVYIAYNTKFEKFIAFRKISIYDTIMTPGIPNITPDSYEINASFLSDYIYGEYDLINLDEVIQPTCYCLSFFSRLSRYEIESHEARTIISEMSPNRFQCQSFLFTEDRGGYLYYDIRFHVDLEIEQYTLTLQDNDGLESVIIGHFETL